MEHFDITEFLGATIDPNNNNRQRAEAQLKKMHNVLGFAPKLLQVVMRNDVSLSVRQVGAVCLKNMVSKAWHEQEEGEVVDYIIYKQDRARVRAMIVEAVVQAPELLRVHLCLTLKIILACDFPSRWIQVVDKIHMYLQNPNPLKSMGALKCLYTLIKNFEYSSAGKRGPLNQAMALLLPILYRTMITLQNNQSVESVLIKKQVLKCHFTLIKYTLSLELHTKEVFSNWMEVLCIVLVEPEPEHNLLVDAEQRKVLPWWKLKKWSIKTLYWLFHRYGSPINARVENSNFSRWYLFTFTGGILGVLLHILDQYCRKIYVSPRVLQQTLVYIDHCVRYSYSWQLLKPNMTTIIEKVLFPILSFSDADQDHWNRNPEQYFRIETFQDYVSPIIAAQMLLTSACSKRKNVVENTVDLCTKVLKTPNGDPFQRDGAFHMIGILQTVLMKKPNSNEYISTMLEQLVFPEFNSTLAHMRARAGWVVQCFSGIRFKSDNLLYQVMQLSIKALLHDKELPVKVEAAIAIQMLLSSQEKAHGYLEPQVRKVTAELLNVISQTGNEKIANVLQNVVPMYTVQLQPMAHEITHHLATSFSRVVDSDSGADQIGTNAIGLLNALERILTVLDRSPEIMAQIEKTVICYVVSPILLCQVVDYYQEVLALISNLTAKNISEDMWQVLHMLYTVFWNGGNINFNFFNDMIPILTNYITVDTIGFISNEHRVLTMFSMIRNVINLENEGDSELYAAKLVEVIVLQCSANYDYCLPFILEMVLNRLSRTVTETNLKLMYMQIVVAMFYSKPLQLLAMLEDRCEINSLQLVHNFFQQWISYSYCLVGIHDRRLCVLAMCVLLDMGPERPTIDEVIPMIIPCCIHLLYGLKRAYEVQAEEEHGQSSFSGGLELEQEILASDEDDNEFMPNEYLENVSHLATQTNESHVQVEKYVELTPTECFKTSIDISEIDEFIIFKRTMEGLLVNDPKLHLRLNQINDVQKKQLRAIYLVANQRKARQDRQRGYRFTVPASVPRMFRFGSQPN